MTEIEKILEALKISAKTNSQTGEPQQPYGYAKLEFFNLEKAITEALKANYTVLAIYSVLNNAGYLTMSRAQFYRLCNEHKKHIEGLSTTDEKESEVNESKKKDTGPTPRERSKSIEVVTEEKEITSDEAEKAKQAEEIKTEREKLEDPFKHSTNTDRLKDLL